MGTMPEHTLENLEQNTYAPRGQGDWSATCSCRNPDDSGLRDEIAAVARHVIDHEATYEEADWDLFANAVLPIIAREVAAANVNAVELARACSGESADYAADYIDEMASLPPEK